MLLPVLVSSKREEEKSGGEPMFVLFVEFFSAFKNALMKNAWKRDNSSITINRWFILVGCCSIHAV